MGSLALGGQVQANWVALIGLVYDPKDDLIEVALEGLDHLIHNPPDIGAVAGLDPSLDERWHGQGQSKTVSERWSANSAQSDNRTGPGVSHGSIGTV